MRQAETLLGCFSSAHHNTMLGSKGFKVYTDISEGIKQSYASVVVYFIFRYNDSQISYDYFSMGLVFE